MEQQLPTRIKEWLNQRGITDSVISQYELSWNGDYIVIPVHDKNGKRLFNKYRKDPASKEGPKYKYDKGATSCLFGVKTLHGNSIVVVCEGELDALALISKGIAAVTSTGGASTFKEEWANEIGASCIYICFDFDEAGFKGALHAQECLRGARIIWLPKEVGEHGDITDFFTKLGKTDFDFRKLYDTAKRYALPEEWREAKTKKELGEIKKRYEKEIEALMQEARERRAAYMSDAPTQVVIQLFMTKLGEVKRQIKYWGTKRESIGKDRLAAAKAVPIPNFIKFSRDKTARCIWHNEKTPSMYYYEKQNRVKCFGCDKLGDVIDVVQQLNGVGLREAIKIILNDTK